jgi:hypothetical protein
MSSNAKKIFKFVKLSKEFVEDKRNRPITFNVLREVYEHGLEHKPRASKGVFVPTVRPEIPMAVLSDRKRRTKEFPKLETWHLESYLSNAEFTEYLGTTKAEWAALHPAKKWHIRITCKIAS